jgi:hypothetical protein
VGAVDQGPELVVGQLGPAGLAGPGRSGWGLSQQANTGRSSTAASWSNRSSTNGARSAYAKRWCAADLRQGSGSSLILVDVLAGGTIERVFESACGAGGA